MAHDVFISHSNQDKTVASAICSRLEQAGIRCWIAPRDVRPGRNWGSEIIRGLDNAKVMIVVLSTSSNCSRPVIKEVERAFGKGIVIIAVRMEKVVPSEALEFFLSSEQWLDAINPPLEPHLERLAHTVKEYLIEQGWKEGTATSATAPPATAERLSKDVDETRRTKAAGRSVPSGVQEPPLASVESAQEEDSSIKGSAEKSEREDAPPLEMEPPGLTQASATPAQFIPFTAPPPLPVSVSDATKEHPFVNSLGMRFVPVPGTDVLFSVWETRVQDYQAFCDATGSSWPKPDFSQTGDHPAVNVTWEDATAFCEWLSQKEGNKYRLPIDHEWSCAVGIGDREDAAATPKSKDIEIADVFPWGKQWPPPNDAGNYCGEECKTPAALAALKAAGYDPSNWAVIEGFNDGNVFTAAVGSFRPNGFGIYDLGGNVWEWCQDEYEPGSSYGVLRGGSWFSDNRDYVLSSSRHYGDPGNRFGSIGFRAVVEAGSGR